MYMLDVWTNEVHNNRAVCVGVYGCFRIPTFYLAEVYEDAINWEKCVTQWKEKIQVYLENAMSLIHNTRIWS